MLETRTPDASEPKSGWGVRPLAALFVAATAGVVLAGVGDLSEPVEPEYADHLWRPWPFVSDHEALIGVVSAVVLVAAGAGLVRARRAGRMPAPLLAQVAVLTLFAAWLGLGYRVLTAGVVGANIGGGGVLLLTPPLALLTLAVVAGLGIRSARRAERDRLPPR